jgi:hypothetical protein
MHLRSSESPVFTGLSLSKELTSRIEGHSLTLGRVMLPPPE